ncbi:MAG: WD40 repeat domain-containing protein [Thermoguttaceae bacterium]|jgi:WD40 repeat protein
MPSLMAAGPPLGAVASNDGGNQAKAKDFFAQKRSEPPQSASTEVDLYGDPIPAGAALRLGTVRFRGGDMESHAAFTCDGKTLISTFQSKIDFWETRSGRLLREIELPGQYIRALDVSPDGKTAALGTYRVDAQGKNVFYSVTFLSLESGKEQAKIEWARYEGSECRSCRFSPDGTTLVIGVSDGTLALWDVATRQELLKYKLPGGDLQAIDVSGDGKLIAASTRNGVYLWPWLAGDKPVKLAIDAGRTTAVRFSPNGRLLAIGGNYRIGAYLWDLKAAKVVHTLCGDGENTTFNTIELAFTPDSKFLVVPAGYDKKAILLLDPESGKEVRRFDTAPFDPRCLTISRDGQWLASTGLESQVNVWNLHTGEEMGRDAIGHKASIQGVQFSSDGKKIVTASDDGTIRTWDAATSRQEKVLRHGSWVRGMALSPDGKWIVSNSLDDTVRLWDMITGKEVYRLPGHGRLGGKRPVTFTPDSRRFCTWGDQDAFLRVWDVATGKAIREFAIRPSDAKPSGDEQPRLVPFNEESWNGNVTDAKFSSDGRLFAISCMRSIYCFDVDTGKELQKVPTDARMRPFAVSSDHQRLAAAVVAGKPMDQRRPTGELHQETNLTVVDLSSGKEAWKQPLPDRFFGQFAFSPDGKYLLVAARLPNDQIRIHQSATGKLLYTIEHVPAISWSGPILSPDGRRLACGMADTSVLIWDLPERYR